MQRSSRSATVTAITVTAIWAGAGVATVADGAEDIIAVGAIITADFEFQRPPELAASLYRVEETARTNTGL
jgi:predicted aconitase with swiveling domain